MGKTMSMYDFVAIRFAADQVMSDECEKKIPFSTETLEYLEQEMQRKLPTEEIFSTDDAEEFDAPYEKAGRADAHIKRRRTACRKAAKKRRDVTSGQKDTRTSRRRDRIYNSGRTYNSGNKYNYTAKVKIDSYIAEDSEA